MNKTNEVAAATQSPFVEQIAEQAAEELWTYGDRTTMLRANKAIIQAAIEKATEDAYDAGYIAACRESVVAKAAQPQRSVPNPLTAMLPRSDTPLEACYGSVTMTRTPEQQAEIESWIHVGAASGTPAACSPGRVAGSEQPTWACSKWGEYEHDWMECPECLEAYGKLNESGSEPPKEEQAFWERINKATGDDIVSMVMDFEHNRCTPTQLMDRIAKRCDAVASVCQPPKEERGEPQEEWTVEADEFTHYWIRTSDGEHMSSFHRIAYAHNAELAAERQKREQAEHWLGELLAVIHRDGGHYQSDHGTQKATKDASFKCSELIQGNEELHTKFLAAQAAIEYVTRRIKAAHGRPNFVGSEIADLEAIDTTALREHDAELRAQWEKEHGGLSDSIKEALNSGDGTYRP